MKRISWFAVFSVLLYANSAWGDGCEHAYHFRGEPAVNTIVLAIDCSGSMAGQPIEDAKAGALRFVDGMRPSDRAAVVRFDSEVREIQSFTSDHGALSRAIRGLQAGGSTRLNDAIARSVLSLAREEGGRIVVYLTDAWDTGSRYTIEDVRKIGVSEGLFVYGIGFGNVDRATLEGLSRATGGTFELANTSGDFRDLYPRILAEYYRRYGDRLSQTGALTVRSFPDGQRVVVNGRIRGTTPMKVDTLTPGTFNVQVAFDKGIWECDIPVKSGHRTMVDARESDLGGELVVVSKPSDASVFLDGTYVGMTAIAPLRTPAGKPGWAQAGLEDVRQLHIPRVPFGKHRLKLRAIPDFDFGPEQEIEVEIFLQDQQSVLYVEIFATPRSPYALISSGKAAVVPRPTQSPFNQLNKN